MSMLNNVVGYRAYIRGIFIRGACIWNEVTVSMCCGLIHGGGGLYSWGFIFGGLRYSFSTFMWKVSFENNE